MGPHGLLQYKRLNGTWALLIITDILGNMGSAHTLTPSEEQDSEDKNELKHSFKSQQESEQNTFTDKAQVTNILDRTVEALTQVTASISWHSTP